MEILEQKKMSKEKSAEHHSLREPGLNKMLNEMDNLKRPTERKHVRLEALGMTLTNICVDVCEAWRKDSKDEQSSNSANEVKAIEMIVLNNEQQTLLSVDCDPVAKEIIFYAVDYAGRPAIGVTRRVVRFIAECLRKRFPEVKSYSFDAWVLLGEREKKIESTVTGVFDQDVGLSEQFDSADQQGVTGEKSYLFEQMQWLAAKAKLAKMKAMDAGTKKERYALETSPKPMTAPFSLDGVSQWFYNRKPANSPTIEEEMEKVFLPYNRP